jgi:hypothetical protein
MSEDETLCYLVDATRGDLTGVHEAPIWTSHVVTAGVAMAAFAVASTVLARGWRLKP